MSSGARIVSAKAGMHGLAKTVACLEDNGRYSGFGTDGHGTGLYSGRASGV